MRRRVREGTLLLSSSRVYTHQPTVPYERNVHAVSDESGDCAVGNESEENGKRFLCDGESESFIAESLYPPFLLRNVRYFIFNRSASLSLRIYLEARRWRHFSSLLRLPFPLVYLDLFSIWNYHLC